ncbi:hypothetical protein MLD38_019037 [Melastoma candidum]|uniref:Uncharacterized protein n=1 Tax=Melastoma candidum TaxID=119954 RepID=A0ACB9QWS7_9MYRT|nr:hypothetical protein MLD38_019037 [Melastoma candidum]
MSSPTLLLTLLLLHLHPHLSFQLLQQSQSHALWRIHLLLSFPPTSPFHSPDPCAAEPTPSLTLVCYQDNLTQLHISGLSGDLPPLPPGFSTASFFSALTAFPGLKVLSLVGVGFGGPLPGYVGQLSSLEILNLSSNALSGMIPREVWLLRGLQTIVLDNNRFEGEVPGWFSMFPSLAVLSLRNNSFRGSLPDSVSSMVMLRVLALSQNNLSGHVPNLQKLSNLQVLDLEGNRFGPHFPSLSTRLVTLVISKNRFSLGLPEELNSFYQLEKFDASSNHFVGPFLPKLLSLPSMRYVDVGGNKFFGKLMENMSCSPELGFVNLSSNLLSGELPGCLKSEGKDNMIVLYGNNCFSNHEQGQHPPVFCQNAALAVDVEPSKRMNHTRLARFKPEVAFGIVGGILGLVSAVALASVAIMRLNCKKVSEHPPPARIITENISTMPTAKMLSDARHISLTMKMGAKIPPYRTFTLEELINSTNGFEHFSLIGQGSNWQVYRANGADGSPFMIRSLQMRKKRSPQYYMPVIERVSKLRHAHLLSSLGHCFECHSDDSSNVLKVHLIFEFAANGTLRDHISGKPSGKPLSWIQRIAAMTEVAKGIQFLHTGIVPGVFSNEVSITDVLLDHNLQAKVSKYNIPLLAEECGRKAKEWSVSQRARGSASSRVKGNDKGDIFDIGVILLELVVGRPIKSHDEICLLRDLIKVGLNADDAARRSIIDPAITKDCSDESLRTTMGICARCLSIEDADKPSVEDVLWNLQFATQVQDSFRQDSRNSRDSSSVSSYQEV